MNTLNASTRYILLAMILMSMISMVYCRYTASTVIIEPITIKESLVVSPTTRQKGEDKKCCLNDPKYSVLGYDNPYLFPYNYCLNLNYPTKRFSLPGWARRVQMSQQSSFGFPGYMY